MILFWGGSNHHVHVKSLAMSIVINIPNILRTKEVTRKLQQHLPLVHQRFQVLKCWCYLQLQYFKYHIATPMSWANISFYDSFYTHAAHGGYLTLPARKGWYLISQQAPCLRHALTDLELGEAVSHETVTPKGWVFLGRIPGSEKKQQKFSGKANGCWVVPEASLSCGDPILVT